jgi:hypothetical protein
MPAIYPWLTLPRGRSKTSARYASLCRDDAVKSALAIHAWILHTCPKTAAKYPPRECRLKGRGVPGGLPASGGADTRCVSGRPRGFVGPAGAFFTRGCENCGLPEFSHSRWSEDLHQTRKVSVTPKTSERAPPRCIVAAPLGGSRFRATTSYKRITIAAPPRAAGNWYNRSAGRQASLFIPGGHLETGRASAAWRQSCEGHP